MAPLLRRPKYRPVLGCVQVVPPQELPDGSLLRGAPPGHCLRSGAYIAAIKKRDQNKISPIRVSTLSGEPRCCVLLSLWPGGARPRRGGRECGRGFVMPEL